MHDAGRDRAPHHRCERHQGLWRPGRGIGRPVAEGTRLCRRHFGSDEHDRAGDARRDARFARHSALCEASKVAIELTLNSTAGRAWEVAAATWEAAAENPEGRVRRAWARR